MIVKTNYVDINSNIANSNCENIIVINLKLFHFFSLTIVKIEFKMTLQSFFLFGIFYSACKTLLLVSFTSLIKME